MRLSASFVVWAIGAVLSSTASGAKVATLGSCEEAAVELKVMGIAEPTIRAVTLTKAATYNPDTQTYDYDATNYVYYYKVNLKRGKAYSFWLTGPDGYRPDPAAMDFYDIYPRGADPDKEEFEPGAMFNEFTGKWKPGSMQVLVEDEWWIEYDDDGNVDPEMSDPPEWDYYVQISGTNALSATLHYQQANALPKGIEDNPEAIEPTTKAERQKAAAFVDGEFTYFFSVDPFLPGRRYLFATQGGTEENPYSMGFGVTGKITPYAPWVEANNDSWSFDPDNEGDGTIMIAEKLTDSAAKVTLRYQLLPTRQLEDHNPEVLPLGTEGVRFVPGRINATDNKFYDTIIDQKLFKTVVLEKGKRYIVETNGSKTNLLMRVYGGNFDPEYESLTERQKESKSGAPLYECTKKGDGSYDVRCGFTADYAGVYYIGVCQNLDDDDLDAPMADNEIRLTLEEVVPQRGEPDVFDDADDAYEGATLLAPVRGIKLARPAELDEVGSAWHQLGKFDWYDVYELPVRAGLGYGISVSFESESETELVATVFQMSGTKEVRVQKVFGDVNPSSNSGIFFAAEKNGIYYIRLRTSGTYGLDCPRYKVHTIVYNDAEANSDHVGLLHVDAKGCPEATWTLGSEPMKYPIGTTIALPIETNKTETAYVVKFGAIKNFNVEPASMNVTLYAEGDQTIEAFAVYSDTYDPKDDDLKGAVSWSLKNVRTSQRRTLWAEDPADWFKFSAKDGYFYDFAFDAKTEAGDAVMTLLDANKGVVQGLSGVQAIEKVGLTKGAYYLKVAHANDGDRKDDAYVVGGKFANVGAIQFAKTAVSAKDNATSVSLTVKRTAKDGLLRVRYATTDGTAVAGVNYVAQEGVLEWEDGDNKAKPITIKLIPKLIAAWNGGDKTFAVKLADAGAGDYEASILDDTATVTIKETSKSSVTVESVYAKKAPKPATTKTEVGALRGGTFYGIVRAEKAIRGNGIYELAAITLTVSAKGGVDDTSKDSLSAKVTLAGKTYSFKTASKESPWDDPAATLKTTTLSLASKISGVSYVNTLKLTVKDGSTTSATDWLDAVATAELVMNVPDANTEDVLHISYAGDLYRQNAKIQAYLDRVKDFAGYYTVALANPNIDETLAPAGHGYLTVTVDNKGTAKVAGLLADSTKVSLSVAASALREDGKDGYVLLLPLFAAKSPYCFGGEIQLRKKAISSVKPDGRTVNPDGKDFDVVVSAPAGELVWNNDNVALTRGGANGWALALQPVGGWYDTVFNLQSYYKDYAVSVATTDIAEFPKEVLTDGYAFVTGDEARQQPNGYAVDLQGDAFTVAKKSLTKIGGLVDLNGSVNPYNVQLKLARATGVLTGSFSLWSYSEAQEKQKEISGIKHFGILLLQRDDSAVLGANCLTAGFFNQKATVKDGGKTRGWTISMPFNILSERNPNSGTGEGD